MLPYSTKEPTTIKHKVMLRQTMKHIISCLHIFLYLIPLTAHADTTIETVCKDYIKSTSLASFAAPSLDKTIIAAVESSVQLWSESNCSESQLNYSNHRFSSKVGGKCFTTCDKRVTDVGKRRLCRDACLEYSFSMRDFFFSIPLQQAIVDRAKCNEPIVRSKARSKAGAR